MNRTLHFIFGDQLSHSISCLRFADKKHDVILMCEVREEATYANHHPKKIAFIFSAMRHFAQELSEKGFVVDYVKFNDPKNQHSFDLELQRAITKHKINKISLTQPSEFRVWQKILSWQKTINLPFEIQNDDRFLCDQIEFRNFAKNRKELRMEFFYREMRKKHQLLMDKKNQPIGGKWNYDAQNREKPSDAIKKIKRISHKKDETTLEVLDLVAKEFGDNFGDLLPFHFAINRKQALQEARHFIEKILPNFGSYQDAMLTEDEFLYHSLLSCYLNVGLLLPLELCQMAQKAYDQGLAPLNSVEGFIRQILGWREFIRGVYWLKMPEYKQLNFFAAKRKLPDFYWSGKTKMNCLKQCIVNTKENAYAHHIQRLMVLGNFALLAAIDPKEVNDWYLAVYADAFEWVELPNVSGMVLFADGGIVASKPYAAGGSYINKMSNYCQNCDYKISEKTGATACPFNYLFWNFLITNFDKLKNNQRLSMILSTLKKMEPKQIEAIKNSAKNFFDQEF